LHNVLGVHLFLPKESEVESEKELPSAFEEPASGSIAGAFWNLCAKIVIHCIYPSAHDSALSDFLELFYRNAQKMPIVKAAITARQKLFDENKDKGGMMLYVDTIVNIKIAVKDGAQNLCLAP
jgi:hypothetical protein